MLFEFYYPLVINITQISSNKGLETGQGNTEIDVKQPAKFKVSINVHLIKDECIVV